MRVIQIVPGIENESAGPSYTVPALCRALQETGAEVAIHTLEPLPKRNLGCKAIAYRRRKIPLLWELGWSPEMFRGLKSESRVADIVHVNGVWQFPDVYPSMVVSGPRCKVVYCPRGGLSSTALRRGNRLAKWLMWHFGGQWRALQKTVMFHAASMKEHDEIRSLGLRQPIAVIPNGVDAPEIVHKTFEDRNRKIVFFGRIHETKAVDHLVQAWGRVAQDFPDWSLEIAGPDCGAVPKLKEMIEKKKMDRVKFVGEYNGMAKYVFLARADLYVLPSLTENFGITIAEALACGTPVIASKGCPWESLSARECGWWIDIGPDALEVQLRESLAAKPRVLNAMGMRGREWMIHDYLWSGVGKKMMAAYEWLCHGGGKPDFVYL